MSTRIQRYHANRWRTDQHLLGKHWLDMQQEGVLRIGSDVFSRRDVVERMKCGNMIAARRLSNAAEALNVKNVADFAKRFTLEDLLRVSGVGVTTCYVWLCVLDQSQQQSPLAWLSQGTTDHALRTLATEKRRAIKKERKKERPSRPRRRARTITMEAIQ
jgi:hypothetical protein